MTDQIVWNYEEFEGNDFDEEGNQLGFLYGEIVEGKLRRDFKVVATLPAPFDGLPEFRDEDIINTGGWDIDEI